VSPGTSLSRTEKCRRLDHEEADRGVRDDGRRPRPPIQQAHLAEELARGQRYVLVGRHLGSSRAVNDEEKLIAPSPARVSRVPAATSNTRAIRATLRSCRWLHSSNIGTSLSRSILSPWLAPSPDETGSRGAPDARSGDDPEMTAPPCGRGPAGLGAGCADEKEAGRLVTQPPGSRPILQRFWGTVSKDGEAQRRIRLGKSSRRDARGTGRPQALLAARSVENRDPASFSAAVIVRGSRRT
jgi:hypothetical protein